MKLRLTPDAVRDLDEIEDYTADRWGATQAERYINDLKAACDRLTRNPDLGTLRRGIPTRYRFLSVARHVLVYTRGDQADEIIVLSVLHARMDIAARVRETLRRDRSS